MSQIIGAQRVRIVSSLRAEIVPQQLKGNRGQRRHHQFVERIRQCNNEVRRRRNRAITLNH